MADNDQGPDEIERLFQSGADPRKQPGAVRTKTEVAGILTNALARYDDKAELTHGLIIREKEGLRTFSMPGTPFIFVKYLAETIECKSPAYFTIDCVIAHIDRDGDALMCVADSSRWEAYPEADLAGA